MPSRGYPLAWRFAGGPSLSEPPADGLFQVDGIHPTALGAQLMAEAVAQEDGLGD